MKKLINKKSIMKVKSGSIEEFFSTVKGVMRAADKGEKIKSRVKTLSFEDPMEMLYFLSTTKLTLIRRIREQPDSITNLAKDTHRKVSAVTRDVNELEKVGIVKTYSVVNPGHGRHRIIELTAKHLRLEASI
ncbi:MAG TPA: MarR family transcriptional regulator [Gammaproteobacteria bacterium]|nr:MarR family transcriptional regulator [Gammaproteobacteria bacterium]